MISVLYITPTIFGAEGVVGGAERYVQNTAVAVHRADSKFKVSILGFVRDRARQYEHDGTTIILAKTDSYTSDPMGWYGRRLWSVIPSFDLIHVHQPFTRCGEVALIAAKSLGKPIVATDLGGGMPPALLADHPIRFASRMIAISNFAASLLGKAPAPVDIVLGPAGDFFERIPSSPSARRNGALYVGRILPHKGIDRLIEAAPAGMPVTVAGTVYDTSYGDYLKSISSGKKVTFIDTPSDRDLAELYTRSAIHVAPSVVKDYRGHFHPNSELMGITTMEALLCGTPVAVANTCSLPELISGARVGECFSNDEELELLLSRVHAGAWLSNYEPDRCSAYARERFGLAAVGRRLSESYQLALGG